MKDGFAPNPPMLDSSPAPNKLAKTSLILGILGWLLYLLQWCFDLTFGLFLASITAGAGAICSSVLDILPFVLWLVGIVSGHVALGQIRQTGAPGRTGAVWGLILGYVGLAFTILFFVLIILLVATGIGAGLLYKFIPSLPRY
ncbi:MAG: DUF4190 domain-containing protein [Anaerolineales bacterium]|jgi:hypothetical protein